jgi:hypothetical protein
MCFGIQVCAEVHMNVDLAKELLNELGSSLENLETQQGALLQFLKDQGMVTDEQLAPYLNQAGNASNVRWRAARVRLERAFSTAEQEEQQGKPQESRPAEAQKLPKNDEHGENAEAARKADRKADRSPAPQDQAPKPEKEQKTDTAERKSASATNAASNNKDEKDGDESKTSPGIPQQEAA